MQYGSEGRIGHLLQRLQDKTRNNANVSTIECLPTLRHLESQKIRHLVFIDDLCGTGTRLSAFWKSVVPRRIKSLLSLKRIELWLLFYAVTPLARKAIPKIMPRFPMDHLLTSIQDVDLSSVVTPEFLEMCNRYSAKYLSNDDGLGYKQSACPIVFEHGCPNNVPEILWMSSSKWIPLFPNRSIPQEIRLLFDEDRSSGYAEALWRTGQPSLAMEILDAIGRTTPITIQMRQLLSILGLLLRGVASDKLPARLLLETERCSELLQVAERNGLYDSQSQKPTQLGQQLVEAFRKSRSAVSKFNIGKSRDQFYPSQCEGEHRILAKPSEVNSLRRP